MEKAEGPRQFRQHAVQLRHSFALYADIESTLQIIHKTHPSLDKKYATRKQKHVPNRAAVYTKSDADKNSKLKSYNELDIKLQYFTTKRTRQLLYYLF